MNSHEFSQNKIKYPCIIPTGSTRTRFGDIPYYEEGLYDLGNRVFAWMVPNGSWGEANAGLVIGKDEALLIDTLWDMSYTRHMLFAMHKVTGNCPIQTVVNTHADGDHFWGNHLVKNARLITSDAALEQMDHHKPMQMRLFRTLGNLFSLMPSKKSWQIGHWFKGMCAPYDFNNVIYTPATVGFSDKLTLNVGSRAVELIEVGPAHTLGDVMVHIPDAKTLFTSDILFINSTPVMWAGPVENWIKALDMILNMDVDIIVPGHGPITQKSGVQLVKDYWIYVSREAYKRYEAGMSATKAAFDIALSEDFTGQAFSGWDSPERIMTNCHVLYRHFQHNLKPLKPMQIVSIMRQQALLAHALPTASPQSMRRK